MNIVDPAREASSPLGTGTVNEPELSMLRRLESRYKRAQEVSHVGSWEYDVIKNTFWGSDEGKHLYGLDPEVDDFSSDEVMNLVVPEDRNRVEEAMTELLEQNKPYDLVFDIIPKNAATRRTIHSVAEVERDQHQRPVKVTGVLEDITERKAIEDAYLALNSRLTSILEGTHAGTWEWNVQTGETVYNQTWAEIIGYTLEELSPVTVHTWERLTHPEDLQHAALLLQQHFDGSIPHYQCEFRMRHKAGHWVWVLDRGKVLSWTKDGKPLMMYGTHTDITESKLAEARIKELLAERELTLKEVHHRIKNNMNTIASLLSLQAQSLKEASAVTALEDARGRVRSMMLLYDKLFLASESGIVSLKEYLPSLVEKISENFPQSSRIRVETELEDIPLDTRTLQPLGIIINELITNAFKYAFSSQESGLIRITALTGNKGFQLVVQDNGSGPPANLGLGFTGGFGLQLVRALIQQLGGTIHIERNAGTTVTLEFPKDASSPLPG